MDHIIFLNNVERYLYSHWIISGLSIGFILDKILSSNTRCMYNLEEDIVLKPRTWLGCIVKRHILMVKSNRSSIISILIPIFLATFVALEPHLHW